jgi:hypothetical protein
MQPASLIDDLTWLATQHPQLDDLVSNFAALAADSIIRTKALTGITRRAGLDRYATLALLLKAESELRADESGMWQPWRDAGRFARMLGEADSLDGDSLEVLLLEQCALSCHIVGQQELAPLAQRHATERDQLAAAPQDASRTFLVDKRAWLQDELQLDWLLVLRQQLVDEMQSTRAQYLDALGEALVAYVAAAHRVALMRYRYALNDPTLTMDQLAPRLWQALEQADDEGYSVALEAELRMALRDTVQGVQSDQLALRQLAALWST